MEVFNFWSSCVRSDGISWREKLIIGFIIVTIIIWIATFVHNSWEEKKFSWGNVIGVITIFLTIVITAKEIPH